MWHRGRVNYITLQSWWSETDYELWSWALIQCADFDIRLAVNLLDYQSVSVLLDWTCDTWLIYKWLQDPCLHNVNVLMPITPMYYGRTLVWQPVGVTKSHAHACVCVHMHARVHVCLYMHACMGTCVNTNVCMSASMCMCEWKCVHEYLYGLLPACLPACLSAWLPWTMKHQPRSLSSFDKRSNTWLGMHDIWIHNGVLADPCVFRFKKLKIPF